MYPMMAYARDPRITHYLDDFRRSTIGHEPLEVEGGQPRVAVAPDLLQ
jgi:hypothetical protein